MEKIHEIKSVVHQLPEKKRYAEFITAVLSVPVLITVLIMNLNNLKKPTAPAVMQASAVQASPSPTAKDSPKPTQKSTTTNGSVVSVSPTSAPSPTDAPVSGGCIKQVGPVEISSPGENEIVSKSPVAIDIRRTGTEYCEIVWSYRINTDPWSEYIDKSIFLYNLPSGKKTVEIKVKSIASSDQQILTRTFIIPDSPTPTATATSSATIQ